MVKVAHALSHMARKSSGILAIGNGILAIGNAGNVAIGSSQTVELAAIVSIKGDC